LLRKLAMVGLVVLFGRGSVMQLLAALLVSLGFFCAQLICWPMKFVQGKRSRIPFGALCARKLTADLVRVDPFVRSASPG
jgi:hypothetical protein